MAPTQFVRHAGGPISAHEREDVWTGGIETLTVTAKEASAIVLDGFPQNRTRRIRRERISCDIDSWNMLELSQILEATLP